MNLARHLIFAVFFAAGTICAQEPNGRDVLYQLSSMQALKAGDFSGYRAYTQVKEHGDFGIGTFENIDGEMIELDGTVYQVKTDGKVYTPANSTLSCYATVTFFDEQAVTPVDEPMDYAQLKTFLDGVISTNVPDAIRIEDLEYEALTSHASDPNGDWT